MDFFGFTFVMFIGVAVGMLGYLVLLITAFTTSAAWGIGSLLVPPVVIAFAVSNWSKGKSGFTILVIGVIIFAYGNWDRNQLARNQEASQAIDQAASQLDREAISPDNPGNTEATDFSRPRPQPTSNPPTSSMPAPEPEVSGADGNNPVVINIIDAHKYINREVRVTTDTGTVRTGTLLEVNNSGIVIDYIVKGASGRVRATIGEDKIHLIELLP